MILNFSKESMKQKKIRNMTVEPQHTVSLLVNSITCSYHIFAFLHIYRVTHVWLPMLSDGYLVYVPLCLD